MTIVKTPKNSSVYEYGVKELILLLWEKKFFILAVTLIFSIVGVSYSLSLENTYKSETLLESARNSNDSLSQSAQQLGQLANLAGFAIPNMNKTSISTDLALLSSKLFLGEFITKNNILIPLFAAKKWDFKKNKLILDATIYDQKNKKWTRPAKFPLHAKPSIQEAVEKFRESLVVEQDKLTGLLKISFEFYSPTLSQKWLQALINEFNRYVQQKEVSKIKKNIQYLESKAEKLKNTDMKNVFYSLLVEQQKKIMLALSTDEYVFRVIDPALVPEKKSSPKRAIICVLSSFLGFFLSILVILFRAYFKSR